MGILYVIFIMKHIIIRRYISNCRHQKTQIKKAPVLNTSASNYKLIVMNLTVFNCCFDMHVLI